METATQEKPDMVQIQKDDLKEIARIKSVISQPNEDNWIHPQPLFDQIGMQQTA